VSDQTETPASLRCRDGDDQKFLDLAHFAGARWLISRDRALLDLAKRARHLGFEILTPALWSAHND
jgi:predicted nucleic acid-binding protein